MTAKTENTTIYRRLDWREILDTVSKLHSRIEKRFPGSGLSKVIAELQSIAEETIGRIAWIRKPHLPLRIAAALLTLMILGLLLGLLGQIRRFQFDDYTNSVQALEASISAVVFIGAAIVFLVSWENRIKRSRALRALHELRAIAHIVDMHQLTKDPETYFGEGKAGASGKSQQMTPFELYRYLDYCSEAMALVSKIAALHVQEFPDTVLLDAVDDVEDLTAGFARKIWQKIMLLENLRREAPVTVLPQAGILDGRATSKLSDRPTSPT